MASTDMEWKNKQQEKKHRLTLCLVLRHRIVWKILNIGLASLTNNSWARKQMSFLDPRPKLGLIFPRKRLRLFFGFFFVPCLHINLRSFQNSCRIYQRTLTPMGLRQEQDYPVINKTSLDLFSHALQTHKNISS